MKFKITRRKVAIIASAVLLTATLAGGVVTLARPMPQAEQAPAGQAETATTGAQVSKNGDDSYIGEERAKEIALAHAEMNETEVLHMICRLDYDNGIAEYDVEFWNGTTEYDYEIDAASGEIVGYDYDMESNAQPPVAADASDSSEYIGQERAIEIALAQAGVTESEAGYIRCEFDFDDGHAEYEVEWKIGTTEYEYTIGAADGAIWEQDVERDD